MNVTHTQTQRNGQVPGYSKNLADLHKSETTQSVILFATLNIFNSLNDQLNRML